jgi:hypothetical protein
MNSLPTAVTILAVCSSGLFAEEPQRVEVKPLGKAVSALSPDGGAVGAGAWKSRKFQIRNISKSPLYLMGHSMDEMLVDLSTRNPETQKWEPSGLITCGIGAEMQVVNPGATFTVRVVLPEHISDREFKIEFTCYPTADSREGIVAGTAPLTLSEPVR